MSEKGENIVALSRAFFGEVVRPLLEKHFPDETAACAFGLFGYGSEALGLDDEYSRDHHWGLRIDALAPDELLKAKCPEIGERLAKELPASWRGHALREGHVKGAGVAFDGITGFLSRTIGIDHPPRRDAEWLQIPEEDIIHVVNGEVWLDASGRFSAIRKTLGGYYPEPVRRRRIAHWCRYFSGMGTYALKRAILRENGYYSAVAFGKALRWGVQVAFLLEKQYCPYDKWTMSFLPRLPKLGAEVKRVVDEAVSESATWARKLELLDGFAETLEREMVAQGLVKAHAPFAKSPTSGYRLLEHAYAEILQGLPRELVETVPVWDQIPLERFHSGYVAGLELHTWDHILGLSP